MSKYNFNYSDIQPLNFSKMKLKFDLFVYNNRIVVRPLGNTESRTFYFDISLDHVKSFFIYNGLNVTEQYIGVDHKVFYCHISEEKLYSKLEQLELKYKTKKIIEMLDDN